MDLTKNSMRMETFLLDITMKTVFNMDFVKNSMKMKMETFGGELTLKTVKDMDLVKNSIKTEKQKQLKNL